MARFRTLTIDARDAREEGAISDEDFWSASIAAGHVTRTLKGLHNPLTGPRSYLVADMSDSDWAMKARLSHMTLSSRASAPPYLTQIIEGIRNLSKDDITEFEARLRSADSDYFCMEFPVKKSRSIRAAKLTWEISVDAGAAYTLAVDHPGGHSLYSLPYDNTEYALAQGISESIFVDDLCPIFEDVYREGFKEMPSFEVAGEYLEMSDSFFLSGGWKRR